MSNMMLPPEAVIPHRDPFLLLTEVTEVIAGEMAMGYWDLTGEEAFFAGHFPGRGTRGWSVGYPDNPAAVPGRRRDLPSASAGASY